MGKRQQSVSLVYSDGAKHSDLEKSAISDSKSETQVLVCYKLMVIFSAFIVLLNLKRTRLGYMTH